MPYVSITGLRLRRPWYVLRFFRYAIPALRQARAAPGNLGAEARTVRGVRYTLSLWRSEADMRAFLYSGAHARAIRAFPEIATGETCGFQADAPPPWRDVPAILKQRGRPYGGPPGD